MRNTLAPLIPLILSAACSHESRPPAQPPVASTLPTQTALVSREEAGATAHPGAATIPTDAPSVPVPLVTPTAPTADKPLVAPRLPEPPLPSSEEPAPGKSSQALTTATKDTAESDEDRESLREIRALLAADKALAPSARQVTVFAKSGRVRLTGQVNTAAQRAGIERAARQAANVREVRNELVVLE